MKRRVVSSMFAAGLALTAVAGSADAACTRLAFSVNDYGKDGPTKDAKDLLDKYVAKWAAERGIKKYTIGKKDVKCELFLDVILFDEHTCRAEAPVCFEGSGVPAVIAGGKGLPAEGAKTKTATKAVKTGAPASTGSIPATATKPAAPVAAAPAVIAPAAATPAAATAAPVEAPKAQ